MVKTFKYKTCSWCGLGFQPVDWLPWRRSSLCSEKCAESLARTMGEREEIPCDPEEVDTTGELFLGEQDRDGKAHFRTLETSDPSP